MAAAVATVLVCGRLTESGLWCGTCFLPSRVRIEFTALSENGATDMGSVVACTGDCRHYQRELPAWKTRGHRDDPTEAGPAAGPAGSLSPAGAPASPGVHRRLPGPPVPDDPHRDHGGDR